MGRISAGEALTDTSPEREAGGVNPAIPPTWGSAPAADSDSPIAAKIAARMAQVRIALEDRTLDEIWYKGIAALRARWYLRRAQCYGPRTRVWGRPAIQVWGKLLIGDRVRFISTIARLEIVVGKNAILEIGDSVFINYGTSIAANAHIKIGKNCLLGTYVNLIDNDFHCLDPNRRLERPESAPITLQDNVWLANRVIVLPGVTIGTNSVVGSGSVVTKDIPPNVLAAGVPARVIREI